MSIISEALKELKEVEPLTKEEDSNLKESYEEDLYLKKELDSGEWVNLTAGLIPYEYGYDTSGYEDLAIDAKKVDDRYNVYFYLETEDGPVYEPDEDHPDYSFDTFEQLEGFVKNKYKI